MIIDITEIMNGEIEDEITLATMFEMLFQTLDREMIVDTRANCLVCP